MWGHSKPIIPALLIPTATLCFYAKCEPQAVFGIQGQDSERHLELISPFCGYLALLPGLVSAYKRTKSL